MLHDDRPIRNKRDDVLGRAGFASRLAKAIGSLNVKDAGFVFALNGAWGSGKTSIIELVLRSLQNTELQEASQVHMWGQNRALDLPLRQIESDADIFDRIADRIEGLESTDGKNGWLTVSREAEFRNWLPILTESDAALRHWRLRVWIHRYPKIVPVRFSPWLLAQRTELAIALMSELSRALDERVDDEIQQAFAGFIRRLGELAPIAGSGLDLFSGGSAGKLLGPLSSAATKLADNLTKGPTLEDLRARLVKALRKLTDKKILIVLDDLDRLLPKDAMEVVALVKSLGDLPNVIFLLSYDEEILSRSIKKASKMNGRSYLEKIVQYSVHVPLPMPTRMESLVNAELAKLASLGCAFDQRRVSRIWFLVLRDYLRTPRDVRRFFNNVYVTLESHGDFLDTIDVLLLEVLRLHERSAYEWIRSNLYEVTE